MGKKYTWEQHFTGKDLEKQKDADYVFGFSYDKVLYKSRTKFQSIELLQTPLWGKLLKLDGNFQTSERDEFFYHELMTHIPMFSHPHPEKVLIIGGGDGGILKNVLMHRTVKKAVLAEIDGEVVEFSRKYLTAVCGQAFKDKRTELRIGDGLKFVAETKEKFDVVILDLTDPVGPSKALYTKNFYRNIKKILNKHGLMQLHLDMPLTRPQLSRMVYNNLTAVYKQVNLFSGYVPLYGTLQTFAVCSDKIDATKITEKIINERLTKRQVKNLKLYNAKLHPAVFALPNYLKKLYDRKT